MHKIIMVIILISLLVMCYIAGAENSEKYILCNPKEGNYVCIRRKPKKKAEESGRLECGDKVLTDGKTRNGFLHILGMTEDGEGWVHLGYIVDDKPIIEKCNGTIAASGRVMSWRRITGGKNGWISICSDLRVYARSDEWAITNRGYVRSKYIEIWHE